MPFGLLKPVADFVGEVTGTIAGLSIAMVAEVLDLPKWAVKIAIESGCETYEEVRAYCAREFRL